MERRGSLKAEAKVKAQRTRQLSISAFLLILGLMIAPSLQAQTRISLDVRDAEVRQALLTLAERGDLNLVIGPGVEGRVTLRLHDVPVEEALDMLVKAAGLAQVRRGDSIAILPQEALHRQQQRQVERHLSGLGPFRTAIVPLHYAKAAELAPLLATLLSPWGTIAIDERTNSLIIRDIAASAIFQSSPLSP